MERGQKKKHKRLLITAAYLFLEAEGDAADGALLDALHQVSGESGNLVSKSLGLDHCNVVDDSLIYMEVVGQPTKSSVSKLNATKPPWLIAVALTCRSTSQ